MNYSTLGSMSSLGYDSEKITCPNCDKLITVDWDIPRPPILKCRFCNHSFNAFDACRQYHTAVANDCRDILEEYQKEEFGS